MAKTVIDGFSFELEQLPAWDHVEATMRLTKILGGGIVALTPLMAKIDLEEPKMDIKLLGVLVEVLRRAPVDEVMSFSRMILRDCLTDGGLDAEDKPKFKPSKLEPIFDKIFRGKQIVVFKLIGWAIMVNFAGFFAELKSALPTPPASRGQASSSTSIPPSEPAGPAAD